MINKGALEQVRPNTIESILVFCPGLDRIEAWERAEAAAQTLKRIAEMRIAEVIAGPYGHGGSKWKN